MRRLGLSVIAALITLAVGAGELRAQPPGYDDPPYAYRGYAPSPPHIGARHHLLMLRRAISGHLLSDITLALPDAYGPPLAYEPLVELPPPRPRSCGRYRYWNGEYCADARYERPYVAPKY